MKISSVIKYFESQKEEYGDIDVICVVPGCSSDWETTGEISGRSGVFKPGEQMFTPEGVSSEEYLFIGAFG